MAAPLAAWLVRHIPPRMLGSLVGGMIVLTNARPLLKSDWLDASDPVRYSVYAVLYAVWALAVVHSYRQYRKDRALESAEVEPNVGGRGRTGVRGRAGPRSSRCPRCRPGGPARRRTDPLT